MDLNDKVTQLEDEIKILKNEVQAVLLDLRESFINNVNPFNTNAFSIPAQSETAKSQSSDDTTTPSSSEKQELGPGDDIDVPETDEDEIEIIDSIDSNLDDDLENDDLFDGPIVSFMPASNGNIEATPKEKNMGWDPGRNTVAQCKSDDTVVVGRNQLDLTTIESLSGWVEDSVDRLGHERTRIILDVTETMKYITPELKNILVKFIHPKSDDDEIVESRQDYLSSLIKLNNLLGTENRMEVALLYILCQEYENR